MKLILVEAGSSRRELRPTGTRLRIGRSRENEVFIADPALSRFHAELEQDETGWTLHDRGSKNGTFVNDRRIEGTVRLVEGDRVTLGASQLVVGGTAPRVVVSSAGSSTEERTLGSLRLGDASEASPARLLVDAAREIASHRSSEDQLQHLLELAVRATSAERGMIARQAAEGGLVPLAWICPPGGDPPVISRRVLERVLVNGEALSLEDLPEELAQQGTIIGAGIRSILCAPLGTERPFRGVLYLDSLLGRASFKPVHLEVVATLGGMADVVLESAGGREQRERLRTMEAQLRAAAEIQAALLPAAELVSPQGLCAAGRHRACQTVGGDMFDFFRTGEKLGVMLADVAGKGLAAALLMANLHARWHGVRLLGIPPTEWLSRLNDDFQAVHPGNRFISMAFALADPARNEILFSSAGHNPALLVSGGRVDHLESTGPIIGILPEVRIDCVDRPFPTGARLVLYSDGVTDQQDTHGRPFGLEGLQRSVEQAAALTPQEMVDKIREDLEVHAGEAPQDDDTTVAVLGRI